MIKKHVCINPDCSKKFRPVRADAEYCRAACKQSHYRARKRAKAEAEALFRVKQNTDNFASHQRAAVDLYGQVKGVEVIATNTGILVAETAPGAREQAASMLPEWQQTAVQPETVPALLRLAPMPRYADRAARKEREDRDFCYRAAQRNFLAAMKGSVHSIAHFTFEPPPPVEPVREPAQSRPLRWWEEDDRPASEWPDVSEWFVGYGMHVTDKRGL
jgi:hypothetical protein